MDGSALNQQLPPFLVGIIIRPIIITRNSATAKSTARLSCLVGVLYDIYRETINKSIANQPLLRNWRRN